MKTMTCRQLGGACNAVFSADTFEDMAAQSQAHALEMLAQGDRVHLEAMEKMKTLMCNPAAMQQWMAAKKAEFDNLPNV